MFNKTDCPCWNCPNRQVGCVCEPYKAWKKLQEEFSAKKRKQILFDGWQVPERKRER